VTSSAAALALSRPGRSDGVAARDQQGGDECDRGAWPGNQHRRAARTAR
jgi:hypothetical protein